MDCTFTHFVNHLNFSKDILYTMPVITQYRVFEFRVGTYQNLADLMSKFMSLEWLTFLHTPQDCCG